MHVTSSAVSPAWVCGLVCLVGFLRVSQRGSGWPQPPHPPHPHLGVLGLEVWGTWKWHHVLLLHCADEPSRRQSWGQAQLAIFPAGLRDSRAQLQASPYIPINHSDSLEPFGVDEGTVLNEKEI